MIEPGNGAINPLTVSTALVLHHMVFGTCVRLIQDLLRPQLLALLVLSLSSSGIASTYLAIDDHGKAFFPHVYEPGARFEVAITFKTEEVCSLEYQWQDVTGAALSAPASIPRNSVAKISSIPGIQGYLGLMLTTNCLSLGEADGFAGGQREVGFALLPAKTINARRADEDSPFGMVHSKENDPYLGPWGKTLTWRTTPPRYWRSEINRRKSSAMLELPIITGQDWYSEDFKPISETQLRSLASRVETFFRAVPDVDYWELGIEENLRPNYHKEFYWENLEAKVKKVRETLERVAPQIRLIYQIATTRADRIEPFAQSEAAKYFDILSLHPYKWPDFPDPDTWLPGLIDQSRMILKANKLDMPIWFTEVGAPHHGNAPGEFFGYPAKGKEVRGVGREEAMGYMAKIYAIALSKGVEKIFWYNYQDRDFGNEYAENFFGMRDFWGYPRPVYSAYARLVMCLDKPRPKAVIKAEEDVIGYQFATPAGLVTMVWNQKPAPSRLFDLRKIGIHDGDRFQALNLLGNVIRTDGPMISLTESPIYIAQGRAVEQCTGESLSQPSGRDAPYLR